jgi:hypothetical protein
MPFSIPATPELAAVVRRLLGEFLREHDARPAGDHVLARKLDALPVYGDMSGLCLLRGDGTIVFVDWDHWDEAVLNGLGEKTVTGHWAKIAIVSGANTYPDLRPCVPARPDGVPDCESCKGTGDFLRGQGAVLPNTESMGCYHCAGLGWFDPADPPDRH